MNKITNDKGQTVIAVGAPGSVARARIQYPALIDSLNRLWSHSRLSSPPDYSYWMAIDDLEHCHGINSKLERESILACTEITK